MGEEMKHIIVLYHAKCLDGFGSAYAAWEKFGDTATYIPISYGDPAPQVHNRAVYILDFSFKREVMQEIAKSARSVTLIDHHKTAQENILHIDNVKTIFNMQKSGAVLSWEYFHTTEVPPLLLYVQDMDLWKNELAYTKEISAGLATIPMKFSSWEKVLERPDKLVKIGKIVLTREAKLLAQVIEHKHSMSISGIDGLACNAGYEYANELGNKLARESGTFGAVYSFDGSGWKISLRSVGEFDVAALAEEYGGGGHKNSAGFIVSELTDTLRWELDK